MEDFELDNIFQDYDFGDNVEIVGQDGWNKEEKDHYVKVAYVQFTDEDENNDSEKISFHVRIEDGRASDVYALLHSNGAEFGEYPRKNKKLKP